MKTGTVFTLFYKTSWNTIGSEIRQLRAFKDGDSTFGAKVTPNQKKKKKEKKQKKKEGKKKRKRKKQLHQELLHSRTAGAEKVKQVKEKQNVLWPYHGTCISIQYGPQSD